MIIPRRSGLSFGKRAAIQAAIAAAPRTREIANITRLIAFLSGRPTASCYRPWEELSLGILDVLPDFGPS